jgi:hypothetical protein
MHIAGLSCNIDQGVKVVFIVKKTISFDSGFAPIKE